MYVFLNILLLSDSDSMGTYHKFLVCIPEIQKNPVMVVFSGRRFFLVQMLNGVEKKSKNWSLAYKRDAYAGCIVHF